MNRVRRHSEDIRANRHDKNTLISRSTCSKRTFEKVMVRTPLNHRGLTSSRARSGQLGSFFIGKPAAHGLTGVVTDHASKRNEKPQLGTD
jgi:hypothetical protein